MREHSREGSKEGKEEKKRKPTEKSEREALLLAPSHAKGMTVDSALRYLARATVRATRLPPA